MYGGCYQAKKTYRSDPKKLTVETNVKVFEYQTMLPKQALGRSTLMEIKMNIILHCIQTIYLRKIKL